MNIFHKSVDLKSLEDSKKPITADNVMDSIKAHVRKHRIDCKDLFKDFDRLRSGRISKPKFHTGMELCKIQLSAKEFEVLEERYGDPDAPDKFLISEFLEEIEEVFRTKNLHVTPTREAKLYHVIKKDFELGVLSKGEQKEMDGIMERLASGVRKYRVKLRDFFKEKDFGIKNRVKQSEFRAILAVVNIKFSERELHLITQRFGIAHLGTKLDINYAAFCDEVEALEYRQDQKFKSLLTRMREQFRKRGARSIRGISVLFRQMDTFDGNRRLDKEEFVQGLRNFGVKVTQEEAKKLLKAYDRNNDGHVSFDEFLRGMRGGLNARRQKMVQLAFSTLDRDGSGVVTLKDLTGHYNARHHPKVISGEMKEPDVLKEFINSFDGSNVKDNRVYIYEFEDYYSVISSGIDKDIYFIEMMEKVWGIKEPRL